MSATKKTNGTRISTSGKDGVQGEAWGQATYFLSLNLSNVRCFGPEQTLNLSDADGKPARWTIILGMNETGKTTLLQGLAGFAVLERMHSESPYVYPSDLLFAGLIRSPFETPALFSISTVETRSFAEPVKKATNVELTLFDHNKYRSNRIKPGRLGVVVMGRAVD